MMNHYVWKLQHSPCQRRSRPLTVHLCIWLLQICRALSLAGLMHLDIAFVQPASANVSSSLSALSCLTFLGLEGLLHFRQQGGHSGGAMISLMKQMRQLRLQARFF